MFNLYNSSPLENTWTIKQCRTPKWMDPIQNRVSVWRYWISVKRDLFSFGNATTKQMKCNALRWSFSETWATPTNFDQQSSNSPFGSNLPLNFFASHPCASYLLCMCYCYEYCYWIAMLSTTTNHCLLHNEIEALSVRARCKPARTPCLLANLLNIWTYTHGYHVVTTHIYLRLLKQILTQTHTVRNKQWFELGKHSIYIYIYSILYNASGFLPRDSRTAAALWHLIRRKSISTLLWFNMRTHHDLQQQLSNSKICLGG